MLWNSTTKIPIFFKLFQFENMTVTRKYEVVFFRQKSIFGTFCKENWWSLYSHLPDLLEIFHMYFALYTFPIYSVMNSLSVALFSFLIASFFPLDFIFNVLAYIDFLGYLLTCYVSGSSFVLILCIQSRSSCIQLIVLFFLWNYLILFVCFTFSSQSLDRV